MADHNLFVLWDFFLEEKFKALPNKDKFRIGEVAEICEVKTFVLRYWESEFTQFTPNKQGGGQRSYTKEDVQNFLLLKKLLHKDRYSIQGAKRILDSLKLDWSQLGSKNIFQNLDKNEVQKRLRKDCRLLISEIRSFKSWLDSSL